MRNIINITQTGMQKAIILCVCRHSLQTMHDSQWKELGVLWKQAIYEPESAHTALLPLCCMWCCNRLFWCSWLEGWCGEELSRLWEKLILEAGSDRTAEIAWTVAESSAWKPALLHCIASADGKTVHGLGCPSGDLCQLQAKVAPLGLM